MDNLEINQKIEQLRIHLEQAACLSVLLRDGCSDLAEKMDQIFNDTYNDMHEVHDIMEERGIE